MKKDNERTMPYLAPNVVISALISHRCIAASIGNTEGYSEETGAWGTDASNESFGETTGTWE